MSPFLISARTVGSVASKSNPVVGKYYADATGQKFTDDVPWCAAFVGSMLKHAGETPSGSLMARSYLTWGEKDNSPSPGTVCVFGRGGPKAMTGHVAFYVRDIPRARCDSDARDDGNVQGSLHGDRNAASDLCLNRC
jgi:uncharacterized protein (TIGR02594 family)